MVSLAFYLKDGSPRRIVCTNNATYTFLWPAFLSSHVPATRPLCRWAARRGAAVHGALRLVMREGDKSPAGCRIVASRALPAGTPLVSLPLHLALSAAGPEGKRRGTFEGKWTPVEELTGLVVRHLHNPRSPHRRHLELLHDLHNMDADEEAPLVGGPSDRLRATLDALYGGNAMHARGADNAPFLDKATLQSAAARVEWVRTQAMVRRVEQSVPYFAAKSAAWGASMVLARAIPDDADGLSLYPIIDFCVHSYEPNTALRVCTTPADNEAVGVKWHDGRAPCVHLVARRAIRRGESLTRLFAQRPAATREDAEFWQMRWGFVPP